jgi:hypothetical protein
MVRLILILYCYFFSMRDPEPSSQQMEANGKAPETALQLRSPVGLFNVF